MNVPVASTEQGEGMFLEARKPRPDGKIDVYRVTPARRRLSETSAEKLAETRKVRIDF